MVKQRFIVVLLTAMSVLSGCDHGPSVASNTPNSVSPSAKLETVSMLLEDLAAPRHPSDGGGRAWLAGEVAPVAVGRMGRYEIIYEVGPHGITLGGAVYLLPSPFWGWSRPQTDNPDLPGYTVVDTSADGVGLEAFTPDGQILVITIGGRALLHGERLVMTYGAGRAGATVDRFAERASRLWVAVDGDGDGIRAVLPDSPVVPVSAGPPAQIVLTLPSVARPGEPVRLTVAVLDSAGNAGVDFAGEVSLAVTPSGAQVPSSITLGPEARGLGETECVFPETGSYRIVGRTESGVAGASNPVIVSQDGARIFWADLHGHSALSDGTGTPEDFLTYARNVAALDVVALTDHDHWGVVFLDQAPKLWREIREQTARFNQPGRFVTLLGFEWTNWVHGHRHVLYFGDDGEVLSSIDPEYDTPPELWAALRGQRALTVAHHSAGGPVAINWDIPPDAELESVTEVVSVHGCSEAADSPQPISSAVEGNFVRDALDRGYRLGFVGSGDSHDGHPGLAHLASGVGGVAAILADGLNREAVYRALKARRVYATNGPRIVLRFAVGGHPMGSIIEAPGEHVPVFVRIDGTAPIERVDVIRSGGIVASSPGDGRYELTLTTDLEDLKPGEYVYVRVVQEGGGAAWSSPVFVE